ncbi:efflux transporter outer membrane subunit [Sphingopyxis sp. EG6]|uniref:efflux transporter outer membrane subunit n=1 Tax=Sphingopyxis sp. EG6 TaxID=1874061 RepID=UPI001E37D94B|nr:efflux transporter outer membrane subunit [Sphingopyxis sp. EG6]
MTRSAPLFFAAALLAGCAAGPPPTVETPPPPLPATFSGAPDAARAGSLAALLPSDDPAFLALQAAAIAEAPSLGEAAARIERARAAARRARAERAPQLDASASIETSRSNPGSFGASLPPGISIDPDQTAYGASLSARWDPDIFGRLRSEQRAASLRLDAATADADAVRIALIADIASLVVDWRSLDARAVSLQRDLASAERLIALATARSTAGLAPGADRVRAESVASASRSRLAGLDTERGPIIGRLVTLTGRDAAWVEAQLDAPHGEQALPSAPAALPSDLLVRRPDIVAAAARLAATDADLAATAARRFPRLTLSGTLGLLAFSPGQLFDDDSIIGSLAAAIAGPLLDFGRISAEIDGAAADKKLAFQQYRATVFTALGDAESAYRLIAAADARAAAAAQEAALLARSDALTASRFRAGLADLSAVLEARRQADGAAERAAVAVGAARRARLLLWLALGG